MKKLFLFMAVLFALTSLNAQKTTTVLSEEADKKPNTTTTVVGKMVLIVTTGRDPNGYSWILHQNQNARGKLINWSFVVLGKDGQVFSESGKRGTFGRVADYQNGGWVSHVRESGSPFGRNYGTGAGVVNGSNVRRF